MHLTSSFAVFVVGGVSLFPAAYAWGAAGHEIVATIAQMYLHPKVLPTLCGILDDQSCHLAPISTWADKFKYRMRWSAPLHYVGAVDDYPPDNCAYPGADGWQGTREINVLDGIKNVTGLLQDWVNHGASDDTANEALKFMVHFLGDLHQPLHLTGRDRGGNSVKVKWDKRNTNLHSLWDGLLIAKGVRTVPHNYSNPLPYPAIEGALRGAIYDPYIRRIMWEGVLGRWANEAQGWLACSAPSSASPVVEAEGTWQKVFSGLSNFYTRSTKKGVEIDPDNDVVCPYFWSQPLNALNCDIVWPKELALKSGETVGVETDLLDLDTPEYAGVLEKRMLVEKLLAQGGIRLAGLLNHLFAAEGSTKVNLSLAIFVAVSVSLLPATYAWGAAGHEIVATIAQIYLHPSVLPILCGILDDQSCHLATISTWADKYKSRMLWSAPLHFVGAIDDNPPNECAYPGPNGWAGAKEINVLDGIKNVTGLLRDWVKHDASDEIANEALKFLVHFLGDMHLPLHLTGRDRGGNWAKVSWGGRETNLHSLWDEFLVAKGIRTVPPEYSGPLPYPKIEGALRGTIYNPFIRRIMWEGPLNKWADEVQDWLSCPTPTVKSSTFSVVEAAGTWQKVFLWLSNFYTRSSKKGVEINPDEDVVCPYFWSQPLNALNCDIVWPKELGNNLESVELDTPGYAGVIEQRMLLEKSLAQGGIRLAGLLNYLFANKDGVKGAFVLDPKA